MQKSNKTERRKAFNRRVLSGQSVQNSTVSIKINICFLYVHSDALIFHPIAILCHFGELCARPGRFL